MNTEPVARILVVDDELPLVAALQSTLEQHGYAVTGASNSSDALALLRREHFELLLADLNLPDVHGIALLGAALAIDPRMIGIIMTGHGTVDTAVEAMKTGALDYVLKPFKLGAVLAVLSRALAVRRLRLENEALTHRLQLRTQELEAANRELEAFTSSASHDLRGPLRAIATFAETIQEELAEGNIAVARDAAARIQARASRMTILTEDLLRLSRTTRATVHATEVDLSQFAREIIGKLQLENPERNVATEVAANLMVTGDPGLLRVALENLLENAWKYTAPRADARIEVGVEESTGGGPTYYVRDNGVGFDMKHVDRLFIPFERLHPGEQFSGTGIGLTTVQRIILKHGGRIWADAQPGHGATFRFTLPAPASQ